VLVCCASEKGGVGKTTVAALLAERWTTLGVEVRLADGDRQRSLSGVAERSGGRLPATREVSPDEFPALARSDDLWLLDLPSGLGLEFHAALAVAQCALVPVVPSAFDLRTLPVTLTQVRRAQDMRGGPPRTLIVPNKLNLREPMSKELLAALSKVGWPVAQTWLQERSAYRRMGAEGLGALPLNSRRSAEPEVAGLGEEVLEWLGIQAAREGAAA
jgi:chromosome partitioning protein